jgi:hypothetical protein
VAVHRLEQYGRWLASLHFICEHVNQGPE